jgi:hypothetical protein
MGVGGDKQMKIDRDMEFTYTVLRNGAMIEEEGSVWDFDNGLLTPSLDDVIACVRKHVEEAGDKLMIFSYGESSIFFSLNLTA